MLGELKEDLLEDVQDNLSVLVAGYPISELGELFQDLEQQFQALGICRLLSDLDLEGFYRALWGAANSRKYYLNKCKEQNCSSEIYSALSRTESIFDAIVCRDFDLVNDILALSPDSWITSGEYEDDYYYYLFLHKLFNGNNEKAKLDKLLGRYLFILGDDGEPRFRLCKFLLSNNEQFLLAFDDFLDQKQELIEKIPFGNSWVVPKNKVFIEGLAWIIIANKYGVEGLSKEYIFCPSVIVDNPPKLIADDLFSEISVP